MVLLILFFVTLCTSKYFMRHFQIKWNKKQSGLVEDDGWIFFEMILAWAQISHCFISFYFTLQQHWHWVNQRVFSAISCCVLSFIFPGLLLCLLSWKAFLYPFFQPLPTFFFFKRQPIIIKWGNSGIFFFLLASPSSSLPSHHSL